ncbi:MAG TPA: nicotinate (nicotinamide) nucleotide adenylyltransferase [Acidobacteriaceae bacterium]|jgi:nicotinate-nucleotide adenylyltransferase|nr:nicotinate (nicotinamide) nucleotide adenylyltransferase [Acidobacteriaceae bacterium]
MRVGFFGGTFDPPHRGHLVVARAAARIFALDRVLLAPVGRQPLKSKAAEAGFDDRLRMVELACGGRDLLQATDVDGPRPDGGSNYTIDTLRRLQPTLPADADLFVIVGADAFLSLRQWRSSDELLALAHWIVVSRPSQAALSEDGLGLTPQQRAHVHPLDGIAEPESATAIRARLRAGEDCRDLVPGAVLDYIREHHLYGA